MKKLFATCAAISLLGTLFFAASGNAKPPPQWQKPIIILPQVQPPVLYPPIYYPPKPVIIVPPPVIVPPPSPPVVLTLPSAPTVIVSSDPASGNDGTAMQTKKYLQVKNNTGSRLEICAMYLSANDKGKSVWLPEADEDGENQPVTATVEPGQTYTLAASDGTKVLTSRVHIWAKTDAKQWMKYQNEDLVLVDKPYRSAKPAVYAMQFGQ